MSIELKAERTKANCIAPQKHVAVASSSVDQPSSPKPAIGIYGLDLSAASILARSRDLCKGIEG